MGEALAPEGTCGTSGCPEGRLVAEEGDRWLKKATGGAKVWGIITCGDPDLPGDERCSTNVLSTSGSADGSETAEYINSFVGKCTHDRRPMASVDALIDAQKLVAVAGKCLEAARSLIDAQAHRDLVEDYLEQSEAAAKEADELLASAVAEEERAAAAQAAASDAASAAGTALSLGSAGLAERARDQAGAAKELVADDSSREARMLKDKCDDIRNNARTLLAEIQ
jgi:hypothetical protein